jgi:prepilin peptidase CpaA
MNCDSLCGKKDSVGNDVAFQGVTRGDLTIGDAFILVSLAILLTVALYTDIKYQRLPNYLTFSGMAVGIFYHVIFGNGFLFSVKGLVLGTALLFIPYFLGGMGAGDAKLMGAVGAFLGAEGVFKAFILTALAGGIYAIILMIIHGCLFEALKRYGMMLKVFLTIGEFIYLPPPEEIRKIRLCYGIAIAAGTIFSVAFPYDLLG